MLVSMLPSTNSQVHGHEVIAMMMQSRGSYTRESLAAAIRAKFGPAARFYTCCASDLTPEELIVFLEERGKFVPRDAGFAINPEHRCDR